MNKGDRVALHPATDHWMRGDRFGTIHGFGRRAEFVDTFTGEKEWVRTVLVDLDKSGKRVRLHPSWITLL